MTRQEALKILERLADGVDPVTGEVYGRNSPYQHATVVRALYRAITEMRKAQRGNGK